MKEIYLIDGMSMVFRAFHAMYKSNLSDKEGTPTGAVFGFTNIITKLLEFYNPEHIAVIFDTSAPTFRSDLYPEYKANRAEFPEELVPQLPMIKELIDIIGIPRYELDGYEADDIIGTLATDASKAGYKAFCVTNDKDFMQLVDENIKILKPVPKSDEMAVIDYPEVKDKFGVKPDQVIDAQAMIGDAVDNIPGVKGVGEKTAGPLIEEYGNLEGVYENLEKIPKKALKAKLKEHKDLAFLSKKLVTIKIDCDIDFHIDDTEIKQTDYLKLDNFFENVGFRTLRNKWQEKAKRSNSDILFEDEIIIEDITTTKTDYKLINKIEDLKKVIKKITGSKWLSFDLETDSLDIHTCGIVGIALSAKENTGFYVATYDDDQNQSSGDLFDQDVKDYSKDNIHIKGALELLKPILEDSNIKKCGQNCKFDTHILKRFGVTVSPIGFDSMLASYVLNPDNKHNLDELSEKYLNYRPVSITSLIGEKKKGQKSMRDLDPKEISDYACEDADLALKLKSKLHDKLKEEGLEKLAFDVEFPAVEALTDMEFKGITVDQNNLGEISREIDVEVTEYQRRIFDIADTEFNIDSPKQLQEILFNKLEIEPIKKTKTGYSTDNSVLTELANEHEIADLIVNYRQLVKLNNTYVKALPKLINKRTGRIHTTYNQAVAATGRLSSVNPNLQNIPIRTDMGKKVRKAFVAKGKDYLILSADYSQIELRIMAFICEDEHLIESFKKGLDIHASTAAKLFQKNLEDVTSDDRRIAKTVNFGIMYGLGAFGLAQRLKLTRKYAKEIIDNYFESYPGIKTYMDMTIESASQKGYAETLCKRRRYFLNINSSNRMQRTADERAAINIPIQGTASDMIKIAMNAIHKELKSSSLRCDMLLQVHDELIFEVHKDDLDEAEKMIKSKMSEAISLGDVPVIVYSGYGQNWFEAH